MGWGDGLGSLPWYRHRSGLRALAGYALQGPPRITTLPPSRVCRCLADCWSPLHTLCLCIHVRLRALRSLLLAQMIQFSSHMLLTAETDHTLPIFSLCFSVCSSSLISEIMNCWNFFSRSITFLKLYTVSKGFSSSFGLKLYFSYKVRCSPRTRHYMHRYCRTAHHSLRLFCARPCSSHSVSVDFAGFPWLTVSSACGTGGVPSAVASPMCAIAFQDRIEDGRIWFDPMPQWLIGSICFSWMRQIFRFASFVCHSFVVLLVHLDACLHYAGIHTILIART